MNDLASYEGSGEGIKGRDQAGRRGSIFVPFTEQDFGLGYLGWIFLRSGYGKMSLHIGLAHRILEERREYMFIYATSNIGVRIE